MCSLGLLRWPRTSWCWAIGWGQFVVPSGLHLGASSCRGDVASLVLCLHTEGMSGTVGQAVHAEGMLAVTQAASWALPTQETRCWLPLH